MKSVRVMCVTGAKGGVGKTMVAVNLAIAQARLGHRVLLFDADLGLANVDVALGLNVRKNLSDVLSGACELKDIIVHVDDGFDVLPASSGERSLTRLSPVENAGIVSAFSQLSGHYDVLMIDTAAGIADSVIDFARASQEVLVVVCNEPTSIADAYALIKTLSHESSQTRFHVIANMVDSLQEGKLLFAKLTRVASQFLNVKLDYMGCITNDDYVKKSIKKRGAVMNLYPGCDAAQDIQDLAKAAEQWPFPQSASGQIEFFVEQLVSTSSIG